VEEGLEVRIAAIPGVIQRLSVAGFTNIAVGLESANSQRVRAAGKPFTEEDVQAAIKNCREAGITPKAFYIVGLPGDTVASVAADLFRFGRWGIGVRSNNLKLYPGTAVFLAYEKAGVVPVDYDWRLSSFYTVPTPGLCYNQIKKLKSYLVAVGELAERFGLACFQPVAENYWETVAGAFARHHMVLTKSVGVLELSGNFFRPSGLRKALGLLLMNTGAPGFVSSVSNKGIRVRAAPPQDIVQEELAAVIRAQCV
jgi:hypothetical protein